MSFGKLVDCMGARDKSLNSSLGMKRIDMLTAFAIWGFLSFGTSGLV